MAPVSDRRNIATGWEIPTEHYSDQPYIVRTDDGAWLCVVTTGAGREGEEGQHVVVVRSTDRGRTWSAPVAVEPADGPEASYAVLLKVPGGRVYCFYNHNTDDVREALGDDPPYEAVMSRRYIPADRRNHRVYQFYKNTPPPGRLREDCLRHLRGGYRACEADNCSSCRREYKLRPAQDGEPASPKAANH